MLRLRNSLYERYCSAQHDNLFSIGQGVDLRRHPPDHFSQCPIMRILEKVPSQDNARVVSGFLDYLKVEKGLAPLTISAYSSDIGQFAEFLEKPKRTLTGARRNDVRDFIRQLFSNQVDGRSVGRKLSALRHLYRYLLLDKVIDHDPTLNIESPRQWKVLPKSLATNEMESILASPSLLESKQSQALELRDRAMLEMFYAGALRVSEIWREIGRPETRSRLRAGSRQGRQRAHRPLGQLGTAGA